MPARPPSSITGARRGAAAEQAAADWLCRHGCRLLARNVHCRHGELDLVLQDGPHVVFAEVRLRRGHSHGGAAASVTWPKQQRIIRAARWFLGQQPHLARHPCRFDVLAVQRQPAGDWAIDWIQDAFWAE